MPYRIRPLAVLPLLLVSTACHSPQASGPELLAAAHRAMGLTDSVEAIQSVASVTAASGGFETVVAARRNGDVAIQLGLGLRAGVERGQGWSCDSSGRETKLDSVTRTVIRGHELHMLLLAPAWMAPPTRIPDQRWGADSVMALRFEDELGAPVLMFLRVPDTLPVGLEIINHTGTGPREVRVTLEDWRDAGGVRLFYGATFTHGTNRFIYRYTALTVNTLPSDAFLHRCSAP